MQLRRYGGDLQGVLDKVAYIDSLGITAIYFNPLNDAPSMHKYDPRHWRHIDRNFGPDPAGDVARMALETPDDPKTWRMTAADSLFLEVIEAFHQRGIRVILDYSWNHTGHTFWAFEDLRRRGQQSPYTEWYWVDKLDDPATPQDEFEYQGWFGVKDLPEIRETERIDHRAGINPYEGDIHSPAVKQHIFNVSRHWLDPDGDGDPSDGVDGFRLDVAAELGLGFWRDYRREVRAVNPDAFLIGEVWWQLYPDNLLDPRPFLQGDVFDAVMNYRWYKAARHFFNKAPEAMPPSVFVDSLAHLLEGMRPQSAYAMMNMSASHDAPRQATSLLNKNKYKFNTSPSADSSYRVHRPDAETFQTMELLLAHQFTYIGAPQIYAGDEMGMWGADDPSNRKPLIWPDIAFDDEAVHPLGHARVPDPVRFNEQWAAKVRRLAHIRGQNPVLASGELEFVLVDDARDLLAYSRHDGQTEVLAVFNNSQRPATISLPARLEGDYRDLLGDRPVRRAGTNISVELPPRTAAILAPAGR